MDPTLENNLSNNYPKYWSDYLMDSPEFGELYAEIKIPNQFHLNRKLLPMSSKSISMSKNILTKIEWIWRNTINKSLDCKLS